MRWLSLFLARQHLNSETNLRECEDQSWFKVQAVPVFSFDWYKTFSFTPGGNKSVVAPLSAAFTNVDLEKRNFVPLFDDACTKEMKRNTQFHIYWKRKQKTKKQYN
jgi:hypothetical protein